MMVILPLNADKQDAGSPSQDDPHAARDECFVSHFHHVKSSFVYLKGDDRITHSPPCDNVFNIIMPSHWCSAPGGAMVSSGARVYRPLTPLLLFASSATVQMAAVENQLPEVGEVRVEGTRRFDPDRVIFRLRTREGTPLDPTMLAEDVRAIAESVARVSCNTVSNRPPPSQVNGAVSGNTSNTLRSALGNACPLKTSSPSDAGCTPTLSTTDC